MKNVKNGDKPLWSLVDEFVNFLRQFLPADTPENYLPSNL